MDMVIESSCRQEHMAAGPALGEARREAGGTDC